ncbi:hypothetical protein [Elstera sp.]|uniref:hypothetical protein n=1 Tax=Elstera sp. TaxID=1916664 RepID=UPI0037BF6C54
MLGVGLSVFLSISSLAASAATTGLCQDTAVATLWNRSSLPVTETNIQDKNQLDFGYTTPQELPAFGGRMDGGLYLPDTTLWSATALDWSKSSAAVSFKLAGRGQSGPVEATVQFEFGIHKGDWTPNGGKIAKGAAMLAIGIAADKVSKAVSGGIHIMQGLVGSKSSRGFYLRVKSGSFRADGKPPQAMRILKDAHDQTIVAIGDLSVVILPYASNCPKAGWLVTFMSYQDLRDSNIFYE